MPISSRSLINLCHRVGTSVRSGVDARKVWELEERHASGPLKVALESIRRHVASGATVAEYVPFLLSTDAHVWESIRTGAPDPRLTPEAVGRPIADHVILVTSVAAAAGARLNTPGELVVSETDAAVGGTAFAETWSDAERMLVRLTLADEGSGLRAAEVLVRGDVPLERIALVAVANDRVRDRVRAALQAVGSKTRVAVYPPWFQAAAE